MNRSKLILPIIVISQFCCTSLWFAGNGVIGDLAISFNLDNSALGHLTSAVQFGFIIGTLSFAIFTIADRFSPSKIFLFCAIVGALFNLGTIYNGNNLMSLLSLRFLIGFFLAGIYPIGMKIAADYFEKGLGRSLGYLVGALVIGTALPHLLKNITDEFPWKFVLIATSFLSTFGGLLMVVLVPDGPFRKIGKKVNFLSFSEVFKNSEFRASAFGYFGHMWELYTFWAFVPVILSTYLKMNLEVEFNISLWSFIIIAIGSVSCIIGGYLSEVLGTKKTAFGALSLSLVCCLLSPFIFLINNEFVFLSFLMFWGMVVIADSPLFSTMVAKSAPNEIIGTALTIVNCIGFSITIISIQLITGLKEITDSNNIYIVLAVGPLLGLLALRTKPKSSLKNTV